MNIETGDITRLKVDAIVNAANEAMLGGGGVDGAIHAAAGPELLEACRATAEVAPGIRCPTGEARITPGFQLAARYVIHTVGPVYEGGFNGEPGLLGDCYKHALRLAVKHDCGSIAFPCISTGGLSAVRTICLPVWCKWLKMWKNTSCVFSFPEKNCTSSMISTSII